MSHTTFIAAKLDWEHQETVAFLTDPKDPA